MPHEVQLIRYVFSNWLCAQMSGSFDVTVVQTEKSTTLKFIFPTSDQLWKTKTTIFFDNEVKARMGLWSNDDTINLKPYKGKLTIDIQAYVNDVVKHNKRGTTNSIPHPPTPQYNPTLTLSISVVVDGIVSKPAEITFQPLSSNKTP